MNHSAANANPSRAAGRGRGPCRQAAMPMRAGSAAPHQTCPSRCSAAAAHSAHVAALLEGLPTASATPRPGLALSPAALAAAETAVAAKHQAALPPVSAELARLLASIAASDLSFAATLRAGR